MLTTVAVTLQQMEDANTFPTSREATTKAPKPPWVTADGSLGTVLLSTYGDTTLPQLCLLTDTFPTPPRPPWITVDEAPGTVLMPTYSATSPRPLRPPWIAADESPGGVLLSTYGDGTIPQLRLLTDTFPRPPRPPWLPVDEAPAPCGCPPTLPPLRVCPGCSHGRGLTTDGARRDQDGDSLIWFMC
jgi:hypothetical protein